MTEQTHRPLLRTQADVERFWTTTCRPLGWRAPELWAVLVDAEGEPFPGLQQIAGVPPRPAAADLDRLVSVWRQVLEELDPGGRVAVLLCRPGRAQVTAHDRAWAVGLAAAARTGGVELAVVHLAGDDAIVPLPRDAVG
jgi:hypothetical protein